MEYKMIVDDDRWSFWFKFVCFLNCPLSPAMLEEKMWSTFKWNLEQFRLQSLQQVNLPM